MQKAVAQIHNQTLTRQNTFNHSVTLITVISLVSLDTSIFSATGVDKRGTDDIGSV